MADEQTSPEDKLGDRPSPYETLGVHPSASDKEIKNSYRSKARKFHPDVATGPAAEAFMKEVNNAYEVLSDPVKRKLWDAAGWSGIPKYEGPEMTEAQKEDLKIDMEEAIELAEKISQRNEILRKFSPMARLEYETHDPVYGIFAQDISGMWDRDAEESNWEAQKASSRKRDEERKARDKTKEKADSGPVPVCTCSIPIIDYEFTGTQVCKKCGKPTKWTNREINPPQIGPVH